jgi:MerR family copper efflux transcriptional regulator
MQEVLAITDALENESDPVRLRVLRGDLDLFRSSAVERREKLAQTLRRADEFIERLDRY